MNIFFQFDKKTDFYCTHAKEKVQKFMQQKSVLFQCGSMCRGPESWS